MEAGNNGYYYGNNSCLFRSASQQILLDVPGVGAGGGAGFLGPRPPGPTYSSLPPSHLLQQPPLLPIPISKSSSLPSPAPPASNRRAAGASATRSTGMDSKTTKSYGPKPRKDAQFGGARPKSATPAAVPFKDEPLPKEGDDLPGDVYSLSPPPSSLPMPKFSLRVRTGAEAFGGGSADAGASDDLRRLLRL